MTYLKKKIDATRKSTIENIVRLNFYLKVQSDMTTSKEHSHWHSKIKKSGTIIINF